MNPVANTQQAQPNVSPEEQQQYEAFVDAALQIIYGDSFDDIFNRLRSGDDPAENLAHTAVEVIRRVDLSARDRNQQIPGDVMLHAGIEVIEELADRMKDLGIHDFGDEELEIVTYRALDLYRDKEIEAGELNQEGAQEDWRALQQANETGELDQMMQQVQGQSGGSIPGALSQAQTAATGHKAGGLGQ